MTLKILLALAEKERKERKRERKREKKREREKKRKEGRKEVRQEGRKEGKEKERKGGREVGRSKGGRKLLPHAEVISTNLELILDLLLSSIGFSPKNFISQPTRKNHQSPLVKKKKKSL